MAAFTPKLNKSIYTEEDIELIDDILAYHTDTAYEDLTEDVEYHRRPRRKKAYESQDYHAKN